MAKYTQAQADSLRNAIASGVLLVDHGGVRIRYRSLGEMQTILAIMDDQLSGNTARRTVAVFRNLTSPTGGSNNGN